MIKLSQIMQPQVAEHQQTINASMLGVHVCIPATVVSYDSSVQTITAKPLIKCKMLDQYQSLPLALDVPVFFPGGANCAVTYQINPGDDCFLIYCDRSIDGWFIRGDEQIPFSDRIHDLSDCVAFVGFRPVPRAVQIDNNSIFAVRVKVNEEWISPISIDSDGVCHINGGDSNG